MQRSKARSWLTTSAPPRQRSSRATTAARPSASRLLVGSSITMKSGSAITSAASAARVAWPPLSETAGRASEMPAIPMSANAASIRCGSAQSAAPRSSSLPSPASMRASRASASATPSRSASVAPGGGTSCWRSAAIRPVTVTAPAAGAASPRIRRSSVVLPTPLRPTRPGLLPPEGEGQVFEENPAVRAELGEAVEGDEGGHGAPGCERTNEAAKRFVSESMARAVPKVALRPR